jgi:ribonuclease-3 family protein
MDIKEINRYNILSLAYLGDSVWEFYVRDYFFKENLKVEEFNKRVKNFVNAKSQSLIYKNIFDTLDDELKSISKRGKNANIKSFAKTCSITEYRNATAFEVLIAVLHLTENREKINQIINNNCRGDINEKE